MMSNALYSPDFKAKPCDLSFLANNYEVLESKKVETFKVGSVKDYVEYLSGERCK